MHASWTTRLAVVACVVALAVAGFVATGQDQPPKEANPPAVLPNWRYQLTLAQNGSTVYLLDTAAGRAWVKYTNNDWVDLNTPPSQEKAT